MGQHKTNPKAQLFNSQLGNLATVSRTPERGEKVKKANKQLKEIGVLVNPLPKNAEYLGSAAVHIYYNKTLRTMFLITQTHTLGNTPELVCNAAAKDLIGSMMEFFGKRRPKQRSGF